MKFLIDSQLPIHLCHWLGERGHDARHVSDLTKGNRSMDAEVMEAADAEDRILISKDADFRHSHVLNQRPQRLLAVVTGNLSNRALIGIFDANIGEIVAALEESRFVELSAAQLFVHADQPEP